MQSSLETMKNLSPVGWPSNLPRLELTSHATFSGLDTWIDDMSGHHKQIAIQHVFGVDHRQRSLEKWELEQVVSVDKLFQIYAMAVEQQILFRGVVVCTSNPGLPSGQPPTEEAKAATVKWPLNLPESWIPDIDGMPRAGGVDGGLPSDVRAVGGPTSDVGDPSLPGYCYLFLFRSEHRARVAKLARKNPWGSVVCAILLAEPGIWAAEKFCLTFGGKRVTAEGPNYTQAHVTSSPEGCKVSELICRMSGTMRVGMATSDLNALVGALPQVKVPSVGLAFDEKPDKPSVKLNIGLSAIVGADQTMHPNFVWTVFSTPMLVAMLGIYESVRLVEAEFQITLDQGASNSVFCAITSAGDLLSGNEWYSAPVNKVVHGSDHGAVTSTFGLPAGHAFSVEIRSRLPGNAPPAFHFAFGNGGSPGAVAVLGGHITVHCAGQALMGFINIGGDGNTKKGRQAQDRKMRKQVARVQDSLGYDIDMEVSTVGDGDDSESEEEDEVAPTRQVTRTSPSAAANSSRPVAR